MILKVIDKEFSICKLLDTKNIDFNFDFCFVSKTDNEISLVCPTDFVPENTFEQDNGWKAFRIEGILDFSLVGILSKISAILADNKIGIFAISTYNTDYILTKSENFNRALLVLRNSGYDIAE